MGKDFAVSRSQDGVTWVQVHNESGGAFNTGGAFTLGFFVSSGDTTSTVTASYDNISIRAPQANYRSSWIGNSDSTSSAGYVSNAINSLWVAADGSCYTNSYWDEGGQGAKIYKDGAIVTDYRKENEAIGSNYSGEGSITGDATSTFLVARTSVYRGDLAAQGAATTPIYFASSLYDDAHSINVISGMAVVGSNLYVADSRSQMVRVARSAVTKCY